MLDQNIFENDIDIHDLQKIGKILQFRIDETQNKYMGLYKYEGENIAQSCACMRIHEK